MKKSLVILKKILVFIITTILSILLIFSLLCLYLNISGKLVVYKIDGSSMMPNYQNSNYILVTNIDQTYKRGDVVAIKLDNGSFVIKRIIGLPNDRINLLNREIKINDENYIENYPLILTKEYEEKNFQLASNEIFIMGDNRDKSYDSRDYGPLKQEQILGKVVYQLDTNNNNNITLKQIESVFKNMKGE